MANNINQSDDIYPIKHSKKRKRRKVKNLLMNYIPKTKKDFNINRMFDRLKGDMYYHGN